MSNYMEELYIFAFNVTAAQNARGFSEMDLAAIMGVEVSYLNKILNARRQPGFRMIHRIAEALDMPAGELLSTIPPPEELQKFKESLIELHRKNLERKKQQAASKPRNSKTTRKNSTAAK
ncbi:Helix-turn-helix [Chitinophaga jiangningensis]|uniref:Helix-turn-helix n=1 Tax=Chitinophaga jiangningensis TaxID=1419482 RepID=A0A1M6WNK7_9BACT|nr:helix-turn-helix transcriptional regulator [Chitinophaga jiangningensis]SHK95353.1 Helix-turn-helix [Chitinophaga jiangningensis]